jgi:hypothetical protein
MVVEVPGDEALERPAHLGFPLVKGNEGVAPHLRFHRKPFNGAGDAENRTAKTRQRFIQDSSARLLPVAEGLTIAVVVITCPITGERIRGIVKNVANARTLEPIELVECLACWQIHYVSPASGKVLGQSQQLS